MDELKRVIIPTADGSTTVMLSHSGVTYHSTHGARAESSLIYIQYGLEHWLELNQEKNPVIFEMGFGTGLNAFLTALLARKEGIKVDYTTCELFPLPPEETRLLNYSATDADSRLFGKMHQCAWNSVAQIDDHFALTKLNEDLLLVPLEQRYHLIYFDAFSPNEQPELWTEDVFKKMFNALLPGGILTTYCSKSVVRKAMKSAGFQVSKLPGPRGKREVLRGYRRL